MFIFKKSYYYDYGLLWKGIHVRQGYGTIWMVLWVVYEPCGAGAGAVAVGPAARRFSAAMSLGVLRQAMSGCLFLQLLRSQRPLTT